MQESEEFQRKDPHGLTCGSQSVFLFSEHEELAEYVVCHDDEELDQNLGDLVVHVDHRDEKGHAPHIHEQCGDTCTEERHRFLEDIPVLAFKDVLPVGDIGKKTYFRLVT